MARRKDSPQKAAMREMMRDYLKNNDISIKNGTDVNSIMRDISEIAYSARTAHPFQRNGAPFRFRLSKAQQVY